MNDSALNPTRRPRAVLYSRLSRESVVSTSLKGQDADLNALADREGWTVAAEFADEGASGGKRRANADEAVRMLRDGEVDVLAAYSVDRFSRLGIGEDAELVRIVRSLPGARVVFIREGIDSLADPKGWAMRLTMASEMARGEREVMVERRTAAIARMRAEGRNPGHGPAPFGYRSAPFDDGRPGRRFVVDAEEASVIREVADRLMAGESASALARELTQRAIPMPRSAFRLAQIAGQATTNPTSGQPLETGLWSSSRVTQIWVSDHLLGRLMHNTKRTQEGARSSGTTRSGEPVLDPATGLPLQAFEPVLTLETMLALRERFATNPGRGKQRKRRQARLLSGLVFCGNTGAPVYVLTSQGYSYYRCSCRSRGIDCLGVRMRAETLEALVTSHYLAAFGSHPAFSIVERRSGSDAEAGVASLTEQIKATTAAMAEDDADVAALTASLADLKRRRATLRDAVPTRVLERVDLGMTWEALFLSSEDVDTRRRYLAAAYDHVAVYRPDAPERVKFVPKHDDALVAEDFTE